MDLKGWRRAKVNIQQITKAYLMTYFCGLLAVIALLPIFTFGEYDDYAVTAVSIINEGNFAISSNDIERYREMFPEWRQNDILFSGRFTKSGEELNWYFPTYSLACVPMILLMHRIGLPAEYAFSFVNLIAYVAMLWVICRFLKVDDKKKLGLILLLSIGTVFFYYRWVSAEVFVAALLGCSMVFWFNKSYVPAALFLSVASTLNPTILAIGMVMIAEKLITEYLALKRDDYQKEQIWSACVRIIRFGCCFFIGLIPMVYNFYHTGYINMTASYSILRTDSISPFARFLAYLFDLNFGVLPYYPFILILSIVMLVIAVYKKVWRYVMMVVACVGTMLAFSLTIHINCGMTGIARYNFWIVVVLLFAVVLFWDKCFLNKAALYVLIGISCIYQGALVQNYGMVSYLDMTPIASYVLKYQPALYNPLHSTFFSRTAHVDGGYSFETPVIYYDNEGKIRKVLAAEKDIEYLLQIAGGTSEDMAWFYQQVQQLRPEKSYLSVPQGRNLRFFPLYSTDSPILFRREENNESPFNVRGLSGVEENFTWTDGKEFGIWFKVDSNLVGETLVANFDLAGVFGAAQTAIVTANGMPVYEGVLVGDDDLTFHFTVPESGAVEITVKLPDAKSPRELGMSDDGRQLGAAIQKFTLTKSEN